MSHDGALLPIEVPSSLQTLVLQYMRRQIEVELRALVIELGAHTLTWERVTCGLGLIAGYYKVVSAIEGQTRQQRVEQEEEMQRWQRDV